MQLSGLISNLSAKKGSIYTLEEGNAVRRSHSGLADDCARARDALRHWGVEAGSRVGIYAPNSYHWLVYDLALIEIGAISVPFTEDFVGQINQALLDRYNISLLLLSKSSENLFPEKPAHIAFIDAGNDNIRVLKQSRSGDADEADQHSLVFSSGSSGGLKGLVISRKGVEATLPPIMDAIGASPRDRLLLFLPMSNFQQRNMCYAALWYDFDLIITDYTQLFFAMEALNPSILIAPPVLYQMIHGEFARYPAWKKRLYGVAGSALALIPFAAGRRAIARILFRDFYKQLGSNMRVLVTGMAPIRRNIGQFFEWLQLPLCESYGMVEAGSLTFRAPSSKRYGSVGKLLDGVEISFESDGEIVVHRENPLALRYFQCADGENETTFVGINKIATGDIGQLDKDGYLYLQGRKKALIVTSGGYKIHPEVIEEELDNCPEVAHSVVFLKRDASHLICVVSLNESGNEQAKANVRKFAANMQTSKKAAQYMDIIFADVAFSQDNGMLRPNMKIDRKGIAAKYNL
jgi:long-chain acyl-CoA synthetase